MRPWLIAAVLAILVLGPASAHAWECTRLHSVALDGPGFYAGLSVDAVSIDAASSAPGPGPDVTPPRWDGMVTPHVYRCGVGAISDVVLTLNSATDDHTPAREIAYGIWTDPDAPPVVLLVTDRDLEDTTDTGGHCHHVIEVGIPLLWIAPIDNAGNIGPRTEVTLFTYWFEAREQRDRPDVAVPAGVAVALAALAGLLLWRRRRRTLVP